MRFVLIALLPLAVVAAAWYWRDAINKAFPWLVGWRSVVLNAIPAVLIAAGELVGYLAGFNWDAVISGQGAIYLTLGFNVANIAMRGLTSTPIGTTGTQ
jgi:hypothetical protein